MAAGVIRGILMGTAVSVAGLSALSLFSGMPPQAPQVAQMPVTPAPRGDDTATPPETVAVELPAGTPFNTPREDVQASLPQADATPQTGPAPTLDTALGAAPQPVPLTLAARDPAAAPQADQGSSTQPAAPQVTDAPVVSAPVAGADPSSAAPNAPLRPDAPGAGPVVTGSAAPPMSSDPAQPDQDMARTEDTLTVPSPSEEETGMAALAPMPAPVPAPRRTPLPVIQPSPPAVSPEQAAPAAPMPAPETAPIIRPAIGTPATSLVDRPAADSSAPVDAINSSTDNQIPLRRNAVAFDDPENRPRLAIVLIDRGDSAIGLDALQEFPYPLTFAVDAARPDAAEAAARYRAAGFEVMAMVDLAPESTPQDAEIALEVSLAAVPDAVAVMEGDATGFQSNRPVSDQVTAIVAQRGYGLVMLPNGLNTAQRQAARQGVPSATVFRDFDGAGQDAAAIRRFLDQGAFRAGQQAGGLAEDTEGDGVIMVGRLRPDTISALILWGLQDRAQRIALAPVSAVIDPAD